MSRCCIALCCLAGVHAESTLQNRFQQLLNEVVSEAKQTLKFDIGMQIGWHSPSESFTVVAGKVDESSGSTRDLRANDTFLYGSGTKPFTASGVMRLVDQGKVKMDDFAHVHIDPYLKAQNGTSMIELFGPQAVNITVLDLIRMQGGIPDFETGSRDSDILEASSQDWPVYSNIRYASEYQAAYGGKCTQASDCDCGKLPIMSKAICDPKQRHCWKAGPYIGCIGKKTGYRLSDGEMCFNGMRVGYCRTKGHSSPMVCAPGNCTFYSSASYELAGLLIAAVGTSNQDYTAMDLGEYALPARERYPSLTFIPVTSAKHEAVDTMRISDHLTTPGASVGIFGGGRTTILDQNPTILGWTCGHMVGAAGDVAKFFYDLLDSNAEHPIVSNSSRAEMTRMKQFSMGWGGLLEYGAGLMAVSISQNKSYQPSKPDEWGFYLGHGGLTYGFSSNQGYLQLAQAGFSITSNTDSPAFSGLATCKLVEIAAEVIGGQKIGLNCSTHTGPFMTQSRSQSRFSAIRTQIDMMASNEVIV